MLQTNGIYLERNPEKAADLRERGVDVFAVSIDAPEAVKRFSSLWERIDVAGAVPRATVMLTPASKTSKAFP